MALVKFYNGNTENLNSLPIKEGQIIFSVSNSNGSIYYDSSNSSRIKMTALADRAIADNLGNNIGNTYISNLTGTTSKTNYVITPKTASGNNKTAITIPAASSTIAGLMTTETQSFSGNKTFNQTVTFLGSADASLGSYTYPAVTIGPYSSTHLEIDANEIMAKANASTSSELYLNDEGGVVVIGPGGMNIRGHIIPNATTRTLDIGSTNNYFRNIYGTNFYGTATSATQLTTGNTGSISQPVYFSSGKPVPINNENFTLAFPNLDNTDMNQVAKMGNAMGMAYLETPEGVSEASYINPEGKTGWFHFINMSYSKQESNNWKTQIVVQAGTDNIYIRSRSGGTITNSVWKSNWTKMLTASNYSSIIDGRYVNISGDTMTGELSIKAQNALRIIYGNYGVFFRNDGSNFYVLLTASGDQNGSWTSQRPLTINNSTGICSINGNAASATLLKPHNNNITYYSSSWNSTGSFVWGMSFKDNSLGGDPGDIVLSLVKYSDTQNTLNLAIDGQINAGSVRSDRIGFIGNLQGNASTATKLQTARTINGTAFDGTANITTANWGSTRNFYIADASAAHTGSAVSVNGSSNVTLKLPSTITATLSGTASNAQWLTPNNNLTLGASGLQYFNLDGDEGTSPTVNNTPTSAWYHILRMNHGNSAGYYADIAVPLNDTAGIYWRQIRYGTNYGWFKLLDSNNYTNYTVTKTGSGASGTWGINITGNAGTATKLQTSRKINGILFNGSFNIDTYVAQFNLGAPAGSTGWSKLGTWSNTEQCDTCYIWVFGGNGQNGQPYQNGELHIFIKDGYQNTSGATGAFGVTVTKYTNADEYEVQVRATSSNSCEVWVKAPYTYSSGKYIISIPTDTIWVHEGKYTPIEPTNGTLQLHEYFTILNNTSNAASATKLQTARTIRTNLSSTSTASFDGTTDITPGITGTLSVSHGGTGATSIGASLGRALYNLGLRYSTTEPSNPVFGMVWLKPV